VTIRVIDGDLLDQPVGAIVNAWNRNIIPWWILLPHGVSGAIKKRGGVQPFIEVSKFGWLEPGQAVHTSAGKLPQKYIIHVASINLFWQASAETVVACCTNALSLAEKLECNSIAFPILGAGSGGLKPELAESAMLETLGKAASNLEITIVRFTE